MRLWSFMNVMRWVMPCVAMSMALMGCGAAEGEEPERMVVIGPGGAAKEIGFWKDGLRLAGPSAQTKIVSGQTIQLTVEPMNGFAPGEVDVMANVKYAGGRTEALDHVTCGDSPFQASIKVPKSFIGTMQVTAFARDSKSNNGFSNQLEFRVQPPAALTGLKFEGQPLLLFSFRPTKHLWVKGTFADGVDRSLEESGIELKFTSEDPDIVSIDAEGKMTGVKFGVTSIKVTHGSVSSSAKVEYINDDR